MRVNRPNFGRRLSRLLLGDVGDKINARDDAYDDGLFDERVVAAYKRLLRLLNDGEGLNIEDSSQLVERRGYGDCDEAFK